MLTEKFVCRVINLLILSIFLLDYLSINLGLISRKVTWIPDFLAVITLFIIFLFFAFIKNINIPNKYLYLCAIYLAHLFLGVLFNHVPAGAIFAGLRTYLRCLPFFFLPSVIHISGKSFNGHLKLLFALSLIQVPLSIYQRFFQFKNLQTGDVITGTITSPALLSIFQISAICFLLAKYTKAKISLKSFLILSIILFLPCTINETKAVILFLPVALITICMFSQGVNSSFKRFIIIPSVLILLVSIFIPIYDHFIQPKWGYGIVDFFKMEGRLEGYLYKGAVGDEDLEKIGRVDSIIFATENISQDCLKLVFGLGIGNVTISFIKQFQGNYSDLDSLGARMTSLTTLLWETGFGGALIISLFFIINFFDAFSLRQSSDVRSEIALAWLGIGAMLTICFIYVDLIHSNITFIICYISGYVATENYRLKSGKTQFNS